MNDFFVDILSNKGNFAVLYEITGRMFVITHGYAQVESEFSANLDFFSENMYEEFVVAQIAGLILTKMFQILNVKITKDMLRSVGVSHSRYDETLKEKKIKWSKEMKQKAGKR